MNNFFNFTIPDFNSRFGVDWDDFNNITEDGFDHLFQKAWRLFWLRRPSNMRVRALEFALDFRDVSYTGKTTAQKRKEYREFNYAFISKGMADFYLDIAEEIVGVRGSLHLIEEGDEGFVWGEGAWGESIWHGHNNFNIFFNVKTVVVAELDDIVDALELAYNRPAFYQIILIDDDWNTLRVV